MLSKHTNTVLFNTAYVAVVAVIFCLIIHSIPSFPMFSYVYMTLLIALIAFIDISLKKNSFPMDGKEFIHFIIVVIGFLVAKMYTAESLDTSFFVESLKYFIFYFIIICVFRSEKKIRCFLTLFVFIGFIVVIIVRIDTEGRLLGWLYAHGAVDEIKETSNVVAKSGIYKRMTIFNTNANVYAWKLVLSLLVAYFLFRSTSQRLLKYAIYAPFLILGFLGLLATGSRGGYLQLLFGGTAMYLACGRVNVKILVKSMVFFSALIALVVLCYSYVPAFSIATERVSKSIDPVISLVTGKSDIFLRASNIMPEDTMSEKVVEGVNILNGYLAGGSVCWLLGLGEKSSDFSLRFGSHIGYINVIVKYGLIAFIPFMVFLTYLMRKLLVLRKNYLHNNINSTKFNLTVLCIGILVVFLTSMLSSPAHQFLWLFLGIISAVARLCQEDIQSLSKKSEFASS